MITNERPMLEPPDVRKDGMNSSFLDAALRYVDLGYAVFPCIPNSKKPLTEHGLKDASTDSEQVVLWWKENPTANIAIRTDDLLILDIDGSDNPWLGEQDDRWSDLAVAPSSRTPHGGRHFVFRQPAGKSWRNTQGRLAFHVDTRANGGYIVAPPSCIDGREYRWLEGYELDVSPAQLPEPPAWFIDQLDEIAAKPTATVAATSAPSERIAEGRRNGTLTSYAGTMRRAGMTQIEIAAGIHQINTDRCFPPLEKSEVDAIAASVARYAPHQPIRAAAEFSQPKSVRELITRFPTLREPVIHGLLRRGETMNVIAPPKTGKSWFVLALAICVAMGRRWLGSFETVKGKVLVIDNELHAETIAHRIPRVAQALGISLEEVGDSISVLSLRGELRDLFSLSRLFETFEPGQFDVIVLDAFYRFMPKDMDENDNGTMASLYNYLDSYAERVGCSFVLIHHATKGNQSTKAVTDVGAGAGSQSRATDTHLVMRAHDEPGVVVLDAAVRSFAPVSPVCLRWEFPIWTRDNDLDPGDLRGIKPKRRNDSKGEKPEKTPVPVWTVERFVTEFFSEKPLSKAEIRESTTGKPGLSIRRVSDLISIAEKNGQIFRWVVQGRSHQFLYATIPQPKPEESSS